jgi:chemotaxis protein methyltransferase CheR
MSLAEHELRWRGWTIELVGTDISRSAIARAREGRYSQFEVQRGLPVTQMIRWFTDKGSGQWQVSDRLRDMVRFEVRTISDRPPRPGKFDIILCRNVLLYFAESMRRLAFTRLADSIALDGSLMLGAGGNRDRPDRPLRLRLHLPRPVRPGRCCGRRAGSPGGLKSG